MGVATTVIRSPINKNEAGIIPHLGPDEFGCIAASTIFIATIDNIIPKRKAKIAITPEGKLIRPFKFNTDNTIWKIGPVNINKRGIKGLAFNSKINTLFIER